MTCYYAVIGNPIKHSKSPQIHKAFAEQLQQDINYRSILIAVDDFSESLKRLQKQGLKGLNVTVPFKHQAWQNIENLSERAQIAGAVNTIGFDVDGSVWGDNTDGYGLVQDLTVNLKTRLTNKRILLLGAGGAARGVIQPLLAQNPSQLVIANRTLSKAQELVRIFQSLGVIEAANFEQINTSFDLIINATSASLSGSVPAISPATISSSTLCYDMMYSQDETAFVGWAKHHNADEAVDGLGMLIEQAAESFRLWRGLRPNTQAVIKELR